MLVFHSLVSMGPQCVYCNQALEDTRAFASLFHFYCVFVFYFLEIIHTVHTPHANLKCRNGDTLHTQAKLEH